MVMEKTPPLLVFDELHKFTNWRDFLKGFYDTYPNQVSILVTGSAKLDVFSRGGDSLMGRYFPFHFHPLTVAELCQKMFNEENEFHTSPQQIDEALFQALWKFGGYPDPLLKQNENFLRRWQKLRFQQLFNDDIRTLTRLLTMFMILQRLRRLVF